MLSDKGVSTVLQKSIIPSHAPAAGENGARPTDEPRTPSAGEGAEAGAGNPAPGEGAVRGTATSKPGRRSGELIHAIVRAIWAFKSPG